MNAARSASLSIALATLLASPPARAHVRLVSPTSRYVDEMKSAPCGRLGGTRSANVTTFRPGQTVTVVFDEIIDHPGYFRIAFDPSGDGALAPPTWNGSDWANPPGVSVLADRIADGIATHGQVSVVLPDLECAACTLQLIQVMTDKPPYDGVDDFYFQCADLVLSSTPPVEPPPPPPPPPPAGAPGGGGCASLADPSGAGLAALVAALRRRRPGRRAGSPPGDGARAPR